MARKPLTKKQKIEYWILLGVLGLFGLVVIVLCKVYNSQQVNQVYYAPFSARHHARYGD